MKGIVLERLKDKFIVLTKDGDFMEVDKPYNFVDIGEEIEINMAKRNRKQIFKGFISTVAVFLLLFIGSYSAYCYYTPQGYVNVDINSSVEISYNLFGTPIKLQGLNEDGNKIIKRIGKFSRKSIDIVVDEIIKAAEEEKFISKEKENIILITVTELNKKIDDENLKSLVDDYVKKSNLWAKTVLLEGNESTYKKAKEQGVSPGKLILVDQAIKKSSGHEFNNINEKSVKEIMDIINDGEKEKYKSNNLQEEKVNSGNSNNANDKAKLNTEQTTKIEKEENKPVNIQGGKKEEKKPKEYKNQQKEKYLSEHKDNKEKYLNEYKENKENKEQHKQKKEKEK